MTQDTIDYILRNYADCTTPSCGEKGCRLQLDGIRGRPRAIVHGTKFQKSKKFRGKLCDRIVFLGGKNLTVAAVELKGSGNVDMSEAVEQIQNGLSVADDILRGRPVTRWFPVLLYSGRMVSADTKLLLNKGVTFRGDSQQVVKRDCGTRLSAVL